MLSALTLVVIVDLSISCRCAGREPEQAERGPDGVPQGRLHAEREEGLHLGRRSRDYVL